MAIVMLDDKTAQKLSALGKFEAKVNARVAEALGKRNKYHAKGVAHEGKYFDSGAEFKRYRLLELLQRAGKIEALKFHPVYSITVGGIHICDVELDSEYIDKETGELVLEDVKGYYTRESKIGHRLVKGVYGLEVTLYRVIRRLRT